MITRLKALIKTLVVTFVLVGSVLPASAGTPEIFLYNGSGTPVEVYNCELQQNQIFDLTTQTVIGTVDENDYIDDSSGNVIGYVVMT